MMKFAVLWLLLPASASILKFTIDDLQNQTTSALSVFLQGDTQYFAPCARENKQCYEHIEECLKEHKLTEDLEVPEKDSGRKEGRNFCVRKMNRYINRIQRDAIVDVIKEMKTGTRLPKALIINGDLTQSNDEQQLFSFKDDWVSDFPIPTWPGLGAHDLSEQSDPSTNKFAVNRTLTWFLRHLESTILKNQSNPDYRLSPHQITGSLGYSLRSCSDDLSHCARYIQLNTYLNREHKFKAGNLVWTIESPIKFLQDVLMRISNKELSQDPILINMYSCDEGDVRDTMVSVLGDWLNTIEQQRGGIRPRVAVFFSGNHSAHEVIQYCIGTHSVPFVYVGSPLNSRFTLFSFGNDTKSTGAQLYGFAAKSTSKEKIAGEARMAGRYDISWDKCTAGTNPIRYHFTTDIKRKKIDLVDILTDTHFLIPHVVVLVVMALNFVLCLFSKSLKSLAQDY